MREHAEKCRMWEITKDKGLVSSTNKLQGENGGGKKGAFNN